MKKNNIIKNTNYIVTPVIRYSNTDVDKYIILKENKNKSGVYRLVNNINGKSYVASSISLSNKLYLLFFFIFYFLYLFKKSLITLKSYFAIFV